MSALEAYLPLSHSACWTLLALAGGPLHGYGIMAKVYDDSNGALTIGLGTMYVTLKRLRDAKLISQVPSSNSTARARRVYAITGTGRLLLRWDLERQANAVKTGRTRMASSG